MEDYARRFRKLLRKATQGDTLAARYQVNYFINGLSPLLVSQVVLGNTDTLAAAIERAKLVETGVKYTLINSGILPPTMPTIPATSANIIATETPVKATAQIKVPVDPVDEITKQPQQLSLNMANISTAMLAQAQRPPRRPNYQNNAQNTPSTPRNFPPNANNPNIQCFNCGQNGHIARNCSYPRRNNNNRNNNQTQKTTRLSIMLKSINTKKNIMRKMMNIMKRNLKLKHMSLEEQNLILPNLSLRIKEPYAQNLAGNKSY